MRPFYCRIGSKKDIISLLKSKMPNENEYNIYVEPFAGSAALLWSLRKPVDKIEVISDLDKDLIDAYKLLKKINLPIDIPNLKNVREYNKFYNEAPNTNDNMLVKNIMKFCGTYGSKGSGKIYYSPFQKLLKLDKYKERFEKVKVFNQSYEQILKKYDLLKLFEYDKYDR